MLLDPDFIAIPRRAVELFSIELVGQILLLHIVVRVVMCIFVADSMAKLCC